MIHNLDAIKEQAARHIRKVVEGSAKVDWKKSGSRLTACCPLHDEKSPSFFIDERQGLFHCFGCNKGGDAFAFLQEREALDFPGSVVRAAEILGIEAGQIAVGQRADLCIFDPEATWTVNENDLRSAGKLTPFLGRTLQGRVVTTLAGGQPVYERS